ncbi:AAA family ATPase [Sulfurospirillum halorespirans]|uniref:ATPase domain-containing protein n=1 Tax=Sulfurospirillum halorespirans DSM 13726 TaxID=1193502 RepID=A0A1D7TL77_9BACT|nr:AAA family ATPase [Sulfurospirillum halorespirans]AOO65736.1 ATPase domain-containing protein [Sulfurospirillum halorespirans DSM 13726]
MELVYLWVEEYKNIKNQGFNFSPRFTCEFFPEYDENNKLKDNCELKITPKEHVNIFPTNINVTAIVGANGAGKSSILEFLNEIFRIEYNKNRNLIVDYDHVLNFCLAFKIKNTIYAIKSIDNHDTNSFEESEKIENILEYYHYSNDKSNMSNQILLDDISIAKMLIYDYSKNKNFKLSSFMYIPNQISIQLCDFEKKFEKLISNDKLYPMSKHESDFVYIENMSKEVHHQTDFFHSITDIYHQFLILKLLEKSEETVAFYLSKSDITEQLSDSELLSEEDFKKYFECYKDLLHAPKRDIDTLNSVEKEIYIDKYSDFFEFDFFDEKNRQYSSLSHGEKTLFGQLLNIYYHSEKSKNDNFLFLFDEPEIALHPNWQKSYIQELSTLTQKLEKNYHFIFASHSPFLLSDIPKENVIFLEKDKDGRSKNVTKETKIETFGANIHTLLSHGFFMKDGLIGEFAKEKINKAITILNKQGKLSKSSLAYCEQIISIIGEPILKRQLQRMLDSKRLYKMDEIDRLKADISELHQKLKKLENRK